MVSGNESFFLGYRICGIIVLQINNPLFMSFGLKSYEIVNKKEKILDELVCVASI